MSCARKDAPCRGDDPSPHELLWEYRFAFGYEKAGLPPAQAVPFAKGCSFASRAGRAELPRPQPAGRSIRRQKTGWLPAPRMGRAP